MSITVDESAIARVNYLRQRQNNPALRLRVTVEGGGCSGFQYHLDLTDNQEPDDVAFGGGAVVTDNVSLEFLKDARIAFEESLIGAEFKIDNPNAKSGCGCGTSFSVV